MTNGAEVTPIQRPRSLAEIVVDQIRERIVTEQFALGEPLSENTIALQLGVSRSPVRDAFLRLQAERLVEVRPQRGTFVFQYDATELREICELREVLETGALRIALKHHRRRCIAALKAEIDAADRAKALDPRAYQPFDTAFHNALVASADNDELIEAYSRVSGRIRAIRHRLTRAPAQITASRRDHGEILRAAAAGEDGVAEAVLVRHVYNSYHRLLAMTEAGEAADPAPVEGKGAEPAGRRR